MLIIFGLIAVFAAVLGGFVLERGNVLVLLQPAELLIICGSAAGILLVSNPPSDIRSIIAGIGGLFRAGRYSRGFYLDTLKMLYEFFLFGRRSGPSALENQIEDPHKSAIFQAYPDFLADGEALAFLCDSFRIAIAAGVTAPEIDRMMSHDMEVQRHERQQPVAALSAMADSLPGLGIVAAVLGVVVTMQALGGAAAEIGQKVAAALVGTFLGILLCYGVIGPLAFHLERRNQGRNEYLQVLRIAAGAYLGGASPMVAAEFARRSIPAALRPSFDEMEEATRRSAVHAAPAEAHV